jgi:uncharacterized protein (DUF1800 family)
MAAKATFDDADVRHLLRRTRFGVRAADLQRVAQIGVANFVAEMLQFLPIGGTPWEQAADQLLVNADDPPGLEGGFPSETQLAQWWQALMLENPNPFQEVLALFWHDHFATSAEVLESDARWWMKAHVNLFRERGAGNFRDLALRVARDWAMLRWLDGVSNTRRAPNENFAREFWELFTRGVDNGYTQADIVEAARAFTGYRSRFDDPTDRSFVEFDPGRHDAGTKVVLGVTIPGQNATDDFAAVVDATLDSSDLTSRWIARRLLEGFCYPAPPESVIDELATLLRDRNYELAPVLRALFVSEAFHSAEARKGFERSPVSFAVGFLRASTLRVPSRTLDDALGVLGHRPTTPPNVNGWPGGPLWLSAQALTDRTNFLRTAITARTFQQGLGIDAAALLPSPTATAPEVVDALAARLDVTLTTTERTRLVEYMDTQRRNDGTVFDDPFDPATDVDERVRGLLYVLGQHPTFHVD